MGQGARRWSATLVVTIALVVGSLPSTSSAQSPQPGGWEFQVVPYLWLPNLSGDVGVLGAPPASVDISASDLVENLDFGAMLALEAGRGRLRLMFDGLYTKVSESAATPSQAFSRVDVVNQMGVLQPAVGYRVWAGDRASLDVAAGARVWIVDTDLKFSPGLLPGRTFSDSRTWAEPTLGLRVNVKLTEKLFLTVIGDVGGFGASSNFAWQAFGGLGYQLTDRWFTMVGYRALGVDYDDDGFTFDVVLQGLLLGIGARF